MKMKVCEANEKRVQGRVVGTAGLCEDVVPELVCDDEKGH